MAEKGNVLAAGSTSVDVKDELDNLRNSTASLTQMMQTVLWRIVDVVTSAQSGTSGQIVGCRENSTSYGAPET